jgi:hypothetical protein
MISLLSYNPGFTGSSSYYQSNTLKPSDTNKYSPTYLFDFVKFKTMHDDKEWDFTEDTKQEIYNAHDDKSMCITSHRFNRISSISDLVFDRYVRIHCVDKRIIRMGFAMWFFKSHIKANTPWPSRLEEVDELPAEYRDDLYAGFHNWKYNAYSKGILKDGKADLKHYVENIWKESYYHAAVSVNNPGYEYINLKHIIYEPNVFEIRKLERIFNTSINIDLIKEYAERNRKIVCYMGIDLDSSNEEFFQSVYEYALEYIEEKPISIHTMPKIGTGHKWQ